VKNLTVLLGILFSPIACAVGGVFSVLDVNNDNMISKNEAATLPGLTNHWDELDANKDDQLSNAEFQVYLNIPDHVSTPDFHVYKQELNL